jgi:hypothetical protein
MRLAAASLTCALALASCAERPPPVPALAAAQPPVPAPTMPWFAQGRLVVDGPSGVRSCTALLRGLGGGRVRLALLSDEGIELADFTVGPRGAVVIAQVPDLGKALPHLERLVLQAYGAPDQDAFVLEDGLWVSRSHDDRRWYGGDPVLLRLVTGPGLTLEVGDYRPLGGTLIADAVRASAPLDLVTITLRLEPSTVRLLSPSGSASTAAVSIH